MPLRFAFHSDLDPPMTRLPTHVRDLSNGSSPPPVGSPGAGATTAPPDIPAVGVEADIAEQSGVIVTDEQYLAQVNREALTFPAAVAALCGGLAVVIGLTRGMGIGGPAAATTMSLLVAGGLCCSVATATASAWIVARLFEVKPGSLGGLVIRVASAVSVQCLVYLGLIALMDPVLAIGLCLPVLAVLAILLADMSIVHAFLFAAIVDIVQWSMLKILILPIAGELLVTQGLGG